MIVRALAIWVIMAVIAVANGFFRVSVLVPRVGEQVGHIISTIMLSCFIAALAWFCIRWLKPQTPAAAMLLGAFWVALTLAFEFGFGHFVAQKSWAELLNDYNLLRGRVWPLVLVVTAISPYIAARRQNILNEK
ncbi:MAG TPA: hypothetical protein P5294_11340 [Smithellaceae bacterium]|nr:hypothetical protein [Smithellaceae bacterium]HRS90335.1 hypothetical protein [Smithellaceae bacterium]HRV27123.1 hypothetical protein [Smithellaceae bacterium]